MMMCRQKAGLFEKRRRSIARRQEA